MVMGHLNNAMQYWLCAKKLDSVALAFVMKVTKKTNFAKYINKSILKRIRMRFNSSYSSST